MSEPEELKREALELRALLTMEREKVQGLEDRLSLHGRRYAWLMVLSAAAPEDLPELAVKLRERDSELADALGDPLIVSAYRQSLKL